MNSWLADRGIEPTCVTVLLLLAATDVLHMFIVFVIVVFIVMKFLKKFCCVCMIITSKFHTVATLNGTTDFYEI
jgi:hypothetical protein